MNKSFLTYFTISSSDGLESIKFSASYSIAKRKYYMPSLQFNEEIFKKYFKEEDCFWDNHFYIYERPLPFLYDYKNRTIKRTDRDDFHYMILALDDSAINLNELIEMIEFSITMGWNKLKI